ncbi:MAG: AIR synthase-related protein [Candidatus Woesearchaeota archaeon]
MAKQTTYSDSGVNVELGNEASKVLYEAAKLTWENRKGKLGEIVELFPGFSGLRGMHVGGLPDDAYTNLGFDGVGTKIEVAERMSRHDTIAFDLFGMVVDDAVIRGTEPVMIGSLLDVRTFGRDEHSHLAQITELGQGYVKAAKAANVAIVNGEVAEIGARVHGHGDFNYNWGAGVAWFGRKSRMITGFDAKPGDYLVAFRESGFRSNGLSMVRRVLGQVYGANWHEELFEGQRLGDIVLQPTRIYTPAVVEMFGGFEGEPRVKITAAAHITGGGIPEKLGRALQPSGLGALIEESFAPNPLMLHVQEVGNVNDEEAYKTFNMGPGMILATREPAKVIDIAEEHGIEAKMVGQLTRNMGIRIKNMGQWQEKEYLTF